MSAKQDKSIPESNRVCTPCSFRKIIEGLILEIAHNKYKRCLAMAKLCHWKMGVFIYKNEKSEFYYRWYKRWLEIAEYYKED